MNEQDAFVNRLIAETDAAGLYIKNLLAQMQEREPNVCARISGFISERGKKIEPAASQKHHAGGPVEDIEIEFLCLGLARYGLNLNFIEMHEANKAADSMG